jgi:uncharacterized protein (TIGR00369 family)
MTTRSDPTCFVLPVSGYAQKLGITLLETAPDRAVYVLPFRADNVTVADVVHGGAILSLADVAATAAAWTVVDDPNHYRGLTIDISHVFVSAARSADIVAEAQVLRRGGTLTFVDVDLRNRASAELIGRSRVVYKLSRIESPEERLAGMFAGRPRDEQMRLLATLEHGGASVYRALAAQEHDAAQKAALLEAAHRELENAEVLTAILDRSA